ncbi:MAG: TRAP transporter substrate-binding protein [Flammeovirgaceae bacterium]|nr:TRAP transporter substrate-binding protein [Flammeovirgaceae bacterium]
MKINKILIKTLFISLVLVIIQSCGGKQGGVRTLKLGHTLNTQHPVHKAMVLMAEKVKEKSGGKLELEVYHSAQLGTEPQCLELLQIGSLAMTKVSAAVMEGFAPSYKVLGLPYIFKNKQHMFNVQDGPIGKRILQDGEEAWLRGLCFFDAGSRSFYTKETTIESPEDLKGLKIRVMKSITANKMVSAMGAAPMPISFGELYAALQQGVVDGAENNPPSFYLSKHYEVCKYYSIDEHSSVPDVLLISTIIWNRLSEEEQKWIQEAADESVPAQREFWKESEQESLKLVQEAGVTVTYPKKEPFSDKVVDLYESYKDIPEIYNLIQEIRNLD